MKIKKNLEKLNLKVHVYSSTNKIADNTDIYLVDAYGKTKMFFSICSTVFLGGSLIKHGGQNPLEPARYGAATAATEAEEFYEIYNLLNEIKVSYKVNNVSQITEKISLVGINSKNTKSIKSKLNNLSAKILELTLKEIEYFIYKK